MIRDDPITINYRLNTFDYRYMILQSLRKSTGFANILEGLLFTLSEQ